MRRLLPPLALALIASTVILGATLFRSSRPKNEVTVDPGSRNDPIAETGRSPDRPGTIDGASTPELVPNHLAYALFFKFISGRNSPYQAKKLNSFLNQRNLDGIDVDALLDVANEYEAARATLDAEERLLTSRESDDQRLQALLTDLRKRKIELVNEKVALLSKRLGATDAKRTRIM